MLPSNELRINLRPTFFLKKKNDRVNIPFQRVPNQVNQTPLASVWPVIENHIPNSKIQQQTRKSS